MGGDLKTRTATAAKWNIAAQGTNAVLGIAQYAILARFLEKSDFGIMAIATTFISFGLMFQDMGLGAAILHRKNISSNQYSTLFWLNVLLSFVVAVMVLAMAPLLASTYGEPELQSVIMVLSCTFLLSAFGRQPAAMAEKEMDFKTISIFAITSAVVMVLVSAVLGYSGAGVFALVYANLIRVGLMSICMVVASSLKVKLRLYVSLKEVKGILSVGAFDFLGQFLNTLKTNIDVLLIGKLLGMDAVGIYDLAKRLAVKPFQTLNPIIMKVARPYLAAMIHESGDIIPTFKKIMKLVSTIALPVYVLLAIFAYPIVWVVYGPEYQAVAGVLIPLAIYYFIRSLMNPMGSAAVATGKTNYAFKWHLLSLPLGPIALFLTYHWGLAVVAWAMLGMLCLSLYFFWRFFVWPVIGLTFGEYFTSATPYMPQSIFAEIRNLKRAKTKI